jgi:hypothetical protein
MRGRGKNDFTVVVHRFDSDFELKIYRSDIEQWISKLSVRLVSVVANFTVRLSEVSNVVVKSGMVKLSLPFPMNGEFRLVVELEDGLELFSDLVQSDGFMEPPNNQTRIFCLGESFMTRYCFVKNACLLNRQIQFILPFKANFGGFFLLLGSRPPPFDPHDLRIGNANISIVSAPTAEFTDRTALFTARFFNSHMLWHNVMDALVPMYWTLTSFASSVLDIHWSHSDNQQYGIFINRTNEIILNDAFGPWGMHFLDALSDQGIVNLEFWNVSRCYRNFILGVRKTELAPVLKRRQRDGLIAPYEIDPRGVRGLRALVIDSVQSSVSACEPNVDRPLVVIIQRRSEQEIRRITNEEELVNATRQLCPFCDVEVVDFESKETSAQVRLACRTSLLLGIHGSGLIHVAWMKPSSPESPTGLVEFFPYKYTCRNWYEQCARTFGVQHFAVHTLNLSQSRWEPFHNASKVARCHTEEGECLRGRCHDFLRDQSISVDIPYFEQITQPFFDSLKRAAHVL